MTIRFGELQVGDRVGHPSWGSESYLCIDTQNNLQFTLRLHGGAEIPYGYNNSNFFIAEKGKREKKKSGFGQWIQKHETKVSNDDHTSQSRSDKNGVV